MLLSDIGSFVIVQISRYAISENCLAYHFFKFEFRCGNLVSTSSLVSGKVSIFLILIHTLSLHYLFRTLFIRLIKLSGCLESLLSTSMNWTKLILTRKMLEVTLNYKHFYDYIADVVHIIEDARWSVDTTLLTTEFHTV